MRRIVNKDGVPIRRPMGFQTQDWRLDESEISTTGGAFLPPETKARWHGEGDQERMDPVGI